MGYKRYNLITFAVAAWLCVLCATVNYVLDPFGLFKKDFRQQKRAPMERFIKMKHVISNPTKYDSFLFGSSRAGKIDVGRIPEGRYYNFNYAEGVPGEFLKDIQILLRKNVKIKNILIGLDDFSYKVDPASHLDTTVRLPYGSTVENIRVYMVSLLRIPKLSWIREFFDHGPLKVFYDIHETGMVLHKEEDLRIERNRETHVNDKKFKQPLHYEGDRIADTIREIEKIKDICGSHNIKIVFFINPIHRTTYLDCDFEQFDRFKRALVRITEYYDFSGLNCITIDNYCYYETSHYRYFVADMIIARIYNDTSLSVPEDFGVLVTQGNIENHLQNLKQRQNDKNLPTFSMRWGCP
jgi:hypothetical protein